MTATTKYNVGDEVYMMSDNSIISLDIETIEVWFNAWSETVSYNFDNNNKHRFEYEIFATKEELLATL